MITLGGGPGAASAITSGMPNLGGGSGASSIGVYSVDVDTGWFYTNLVSDTGSGMGGGIHSVRTTMLNINNICFNAAACVFPICVSGVFGFGLSMDWFSYTDAHISTSGDEIIGKVIMDKNISVVF